MNKQTQKELLEIVRRNYREIAGQYNETRKKHLEPLWSELVRLASEVLPGQSVLDAGCGNGRLLDAFADKPVKYLGVDANEELLAFARENHPTYRFAQADILNLGQIAEIGFDHIFCVAVFHHFPGKSLRVDALRQLRNKLNDDGRIVITVWNLWSQKKFRGLIIKFLLLKFIKKNKMDIGDILFDWKNSKGEVVSKRYYHAFTKRELGRIARQAGYQTVKVYKDRFTYYLILKK